MRRPPGPRSCESPAQPIEDRLRPLPGQACPAASARLRPFFAVHSRLASGSAPHAKASWAGARHPRDGEGRPGRRASWGGAPHLHPARLLERAGTRYRPGAKLPPSGPDPWGGCHETRARPALACGALHLIPAALATGIGRMLGVTPGRGRGRAFRRRSAIRCCRQNKTAGTTPAPRRKGPPIFWSRPRRRHPASDHVVPRDETPLTRGDRTSSPRLYTNAAGEWKRTVHIWGGISPKLPHPWCRFPPRWGAAQKLARLAPNLDFA